MSEERPPPRRADALERVEERLARPRGTPLAVEAEREAVRLVPNTLEQLQAGAVRVEQDRVGLLRDEDLLHPLRQRDHRHARQLVRLHRRQRRRELPLAAVDDDEVRRGREALVVLVLRARAQPGEAARDDLGHRREVVLAVEAADRELAVVRLLRDPVLEHHHRADDLVPLDVRDVEALDPERQALEVERLAQLLERVDAAQLLLLRDEQLRVEGEPCVLGGQLGQPPLLAAGRRPHLDAGAAQLRQEPLQRFEPRRVRRHDDLRRDRGRVAVVLERERLEDRRHVLALDVLEMEAVAVDHLAAAEREHLHGGAIALGSDAEHVDRAGLPPVCALLLGQVLDREEPVPVPRRVLEALVGGRLAHLLLQHPHDRLRVAGEEVDDSVDDLPVGVLRDVADARRVAALDVEVETRDPRVPARLRPFTGPELEDAVEHVERLPHLLRVRIRPEVEDAAAMPLAA